ncbi:MAG: UDP-N-acetylmuramoyl-tripeptide--D-alanyl-D-alanine ligase [candidate division Zixibacteria bacterium]|nr:UDP-N-acetylmuramoyl-tripeptide--D-alanyl-D-alanine ligase [candidate division Zixibacteria bacterium]
MSFRQLVDQVDGKLVHPGLGDRTFTGVSIDSRTTTPGQLFVAVRGEHTDGHAYIDQALASGAAGVLAETAYLSDHRLPDDVAVAGVENSHEALMRCAREYLNAVGARRIGITGSNGKTTTKEMTFRLLEAMEPRTYRSPGNFNNLFGIPLSLLAMPQDTRVAILEMGISLPGEMARLAEIIRPDVYTLTNVGPTHLESLGTVEGVAREKLTGVASSPTTTPLVINADDHVLMQAARALPNPQVTFAVEQQADFNPGDVRYNSDGTLSLEIDRHAFRVLLFGRYQLYNVLAAYATVRALGYSFDDVDTEAIVLGSAPMRGETSIVDNVTFVVDCYNANPESVKSGLVSFAAYPAQGRRVIVLGDMLELGEDSEQYHREVGRQLAGQKFGLAMLVGPMSGHAYDAAKKAGVEDKHVLHFATADECATVVGERLMSGDLVYLKGSRGIGLEAVLNAWKKREGKN